MGFHQLTLSDKRTPEMLALNVIVDSTYVKLSCTNTYFSKYVIKSVFSYYCSIFAYARLLRLAQKSSGTLTEAEIAFADFVDGSSSCPNHSATCMRGTLPSSRFSLTSSDARTLAG